MPKKQKISLRETLKTPRFAEKIYSATLGGFGEVRRMSFFCLAVPKAVLEVACKTSPVSSEKLMEHDQITKPLLDCA